jgi:hypothetical protein
VSQVFASSIQHGLQKRLRCAKPRQSIVTIFNWTESSRSHTLTRAELGLAGQGSYTFADVFTVQVTPKPVDATISVTLPPHSVRVLKLVRSDTPPVPPPVVATVPSTGNAGETLRFTARPASETEPILQYTWDFGDGTSVSARMSPMPLRMPAPTKCASMPPDSPVPRVIRANR